VSPEARGPESRGAATGANAARGSEEADAESAGARASREPGAESGGGRGSQAAGAGSGGARGSREQGVKSAGARGAQAAGVGSGEARVSHATGAGSAGAAGRRKSGVEDAGGQEQPVAEASGAEEWADGAARKSGGGAAPKSGGVDAQADRSPDPESQAEAVVRDAISAPDVDGRPRRATRRFPLFTRDTARPEGGGRAAPRDAPAPARQWPVLVVLAAVGLGLLLTALDQFRVGTLLIGVALLAGAVLRWLLPDVGMLAVRSRFTDIATYGVLGTVIVLLAMMVQPNPWLVIPFLKDTLHFTVSSS